MTDDLKIFSNAKVDLQKTNPKAQWYFEDKPKKSWDERWSAMPEDASKRVEGQFLTGVDTCKLTIKYKLGSAKEFEYIYDFKNRTQTNTKTNKRRKILRGTWFSFGETQRVPYGEDEAEILEETLLSGEFKDGTIVHMDDDRIVKKKDGRFVQLRGNTVRQVERGYKHHVYLEGESQIFRSEDYTDL